MRLPSLLAIDFMKIIACVGQAGESIVRATLQQYSMRLMVFKNNCKFELACNDVALNGMYGKYYQWCWDKDRHGD
jgi:hypothetical protein